MSETLTGTLIGTVGTVIVAGITWLATRGKTRTDGALGKAQLDEQARQSDITLIISNLKEDVKNLRQEVKDLRAENEDCLADRDQMRGELRRVKDRLAMLERPDVG